MSCGVSGILVGCLLGFTLGPYFVHESDILPKNKSIAKDHVSTYTAIMGTALLVGNLPMLFFYK